MAQPTQPPHRSVAIAAALLASGFLASAPASAQSAGTGTDGTTSAPEPELSTVVIKAKRENRVSKGATNLPMEVKDTPQSISTIDKETLRDFGATDSNDALRFGTGLTVDEWETNRTSYSTRGFDIMLTQIDGLGMTNDWGIAESQMDTYLFEKIELIRGANGLLTGVGTASGTINYVRKRPTSKDGGEAQLTMGSFGQKRVALDYNKVLSKDGLWAGRLVVTHDDKDSYLRALGTERTALSAIVEGQIGLNGVLTLGLSYQDSKQRSPMWGSLTLPYADGSLAEFDVSASTSQDWTLWNNRRQSVFAEYAHTLPNNWEAKLTLNHAEGKDATKLFYAYTFTGYLNDDNTGLYGWPYRSDSSSSSDIVDVNLSGQFGAFGRQHDALFGLSHSKQKTTTWTYAGATFPVLPAFPYAGDVFTEPAWGARSVSNDGDQNLTRLYAASRLQLTDALKGIAGINAIRLVRDGTAIYGSGVQLNNETTQKVSPYVGLTYDLTPDALAYASYSDIFQAQDQVDINGVTLKPMKGVNAEVGLKAEWLDRKLLTNFALFSAEQRGLATVAGFNTNTQQDYYEPKDVKTQGFEIEASGRIGADTKVSAGFTSMSLKGPDGKDIYEWIPRRTLKLQADTRVSAMPKLRVGSGLRWQSGVSKVAGARQDAYVVVDAFAAYELTEKATLRLNVRNLADKKYIRSVTYGAIYGAPRSAALTLEYKL
jgi:outer membrane receptor for ferric coprogen and ferric-rhodotorulic acid